MTETKRLLLTWNVRSWRCPFVRCVYVVVMSVQFIAGIIIIIIFHKDRRTLIVGVVSDRASIRWQLHGVIWNKDIGFWDHQCDIIWLRFIPFRCCGQHLAIGVVYPCDVWSFRTMAAHTALHSDVVSALHCVLLNDFTDRLWHWQSNTNTTIKAT